MHLHFVREIEEEINCLYPFRVPTLTLQEHGEPTLHEITVELQQSLSGADLDQDGPDPDSDSDWGSGSGSFAKGHKKHRQTMKRHIGLRTVHLNTQPIEGEEGPGAHFHLKVNGVPVFARGANIVPPAEEPLSQGAAPFLPLSFFTGSLVP